jgi:4-hydroxy-tetrahydrodipicolinate synthase
MNELQGVYVVMITPLKASGEVNYEGIRKNIRWWISQGVHGLIPLGSTGEFASLEDTDKQRIAETVIEAVGGRVPVVVGASAETTEKATYYARHAKDIGASGVLVLPPYYYKSSQDELYIHYKRLSESVELPIMIYNNPCSSKVDIQPETIARLSKLPNLDYVKESTGDIRRIAEIRTLTNDEIAIFCGWEDLSYEAFLMGAKGWVCVLGNIAPHLCVQLFDLVVAEKDYERGWKLYQKLLPVLWFLERAGKTQVILKYALDMMGLCGGYSSSPRLPLGEKEKTKVERFIRDLGLI